MQPRSAAFDRAITAGVPQAICQALPLKRGVPYGPVIDLLPGATVVLDETQASRRVFAGSVANDGTLAPRVPTDALAPFGMELAVRTGIQYTDGSTETIPTGIFRLETAAMNMLGQIDLTGNDRSIVIANAGNEQPFIMPGGQPLDEAIGRYIASKYPAMPFIPNAACHQMVLGPTPTVFPEGSDENAWTDSMSLAFGFGCELFVNAEGSAILQPMPDPTLLTPSWIYTPGPANLATAGNTTLDVSPGNVYNVVVVESSGTGIPVPIQGSAEVTDPRSPIYPDPDGFGRRVLFYQTSQLGSVEQCNFTARQILNRFTGTATNPAFSGVPHPCHEPGDVVVFASNALGIATTTCLSSWTFQLDMQAASAYTTRMTASSLTSVLPINITVG